MHHGRAGDRAGRTSDSLNFSFGDWRRACLARFGKNSLWFPRRNKLDYKFTIISPGSDFERLYEYECPCYRKGDGTFDRNDLCDVDHIVATNRGGTSKIDNGMALCLNCHRVKTNYEKKNKKSM